MEQEEQEEDTCKVKDKIYELVSDQMLVDKNTLTDKMHLSNDLHANELDMIEIVMDIEDMFNIDIEDSWLRCNYTIGEIVSFVKSKV